MTDQRAALSSHIPSLDGLRALAVLGVLFSHSAMTGTRLDWIFFGLPWGHLGVRLFFVLSGFLITRILLDHKSYIDNEQRSVSAALTTFYYRRFLRIFPIFYLTIGIAYAFDVGHMREVARFHMLYLSNFEPVLFENFRVAPLVLRDPTSAHFWSLAVEEQFYLLWPAIVLCLPLGALRKFTIGIILFAVLWRTAWLVAVPKLPSEALFACLDSLGLGALLAISLKTSDPSVRFWTGRWFLISAAVLFVACCGAYIAGILWRPNQVLFDLSSSALFASLIYRATLRQTGLAWRALQSGPMVYIGKISYGIYIYHAFVPWLEQWLLRQARLPYPPHDTILPTIIFIAMTIAVSAISWHFLERPILSLKSNKIGCKQPPIVVSSQQQSSSSTA